MGDSRIKTVKLNEENIIHWGGIHKQKYTPDQQAKVTSGVLAGQVGTVASVVDVGVWLSFPHYLALVSHRDVQFQNG